MEATRLPIKDHTKLYNIGALSHADLELAVGGKEAAGVAAGLDSDHLSAFAHGDIAHSNRTALNLVSGTNTGDQDLSSYLKKDGTVALTAGLDFAKFKAIQMVCDNGTSFPASPTGPQWFYRSDIKTRFIYEGGWKADISFGAVTLYVDGGGHIASGVIAAAGSGYVAGNVLSVVDGANGIAGQFTVSTVDGSGGVTGITLLNGGGTYTTGTKTTTALTGVGTGCTITLTISSVIGSSAVGQGYASGSGAVLTITDAISLIPSVSGGSIVVDIAEGTYADTILIGGKAFSGPYTITLKGTLSLIETITASSGVTGTGDTQGTIVRNSGSWTLNQRKNLLIKGTSGNNNGIYRIVDSNIAGDTATICGVWGGAVANGDTFEIYDWGTVLSNTSSDHTISSGQSGIVFDSVKSLRALYTSSLSTLTIYRTNITCTATTYGVTISKFSMFDSYYSYIQNSYNAILNYGGRYAPNYSKHYTTAGPEVLVSVSGAITLMGGGGNIFEGSNTGIGMAAHTGAYINCAVGAVKGKTQIKNCLIGLAADGSGQAFYSTNYVCFTSVTTPFVEESMHSVTGTKRLGGRTVEGSTALVAGTKTITLTNAATFTSATSYTVNVSRTVTTGVGVVNNSGSQFTITSANLADTDTVRFVATGD